jgi:hypothetical protein
LNRRKKQKSFGSWLFLNKPVNDVFSRYPTVVTVCLLSSVAVAESLYSEWQQRDIKALSNKAIEDYSSGNGMGFALERN